MKIFVDIDETICEYLHPNERSYENAIPIYDNIKKVNLLYENGHDITFWTARGTVTNIDWTELTKTQLENWKVKYHNLLFGKPDYDLYIDDKSLNSIFNWNDTNVATILSNKIIKK